MQAKKILTAFALIAILLLAGCAGTTTSTGTAPMVINQAGSSTVLPIAQAWQYEFETAINAKIVVGGGGSGTGISRFCKGELHIADASRPIKSSETAKCQEHVPPINPFEIQVAIDGIAVVVAQSNTFVDCLTVDQLNRMWTSDPARQVNNWKQLNPAWPDEKIGLFGPGTDSGTFDYWKEAIITGVEGSGGNIRSDFTANEDDNSLVAGVASSPHGMGYFGLAYYERNQAKLNVVKVDAGEGQGCVEPTAANVEAGTYSPLARPLFMYTDGKPSGTLKAYFDKGLSQAGQEKVQLVGYIPLPPAKLAEMRAKIA